MIKFREKQVENFQMVTRKDITEAFVLDAVNEKMDECPTLYKKGDYISFYIIVNKIMGCKSVGVFTYTTLRTAVDTTEMHRQIFDSQPNTIYVYGTGVIESDGTYIFDVDALETYSN